MRGLTWRDGVATVVVAAILTIYLWWLADAAPVDGVRGVAAFGLIFGFAAGVLGTQVTAERMSGAGMSLGVLTATAGVLALVTASEVALAVFIAPVLVLWAATTARHAGRSSRATGTPRHRAGSRGSS